MKEIKTHKDLLKFLTDLYCNNFKSHIFTPWSLVYYKVIIAFNEVLSHGEKEEIMDLYKHLPKMELDYLVSPGVDYSQIKSTYFDEEEIVKFKKLNFLLFTGVENELREYYSLRAHDRDLISSIDETKLKDSKGIKAISIIITLILITILGISIYLIETMDELLLFSIVFSISAIIVSAIIMNKVYRKSK